MKNYKGQYILALADTDIDELSISALGHKISKKNSDEDVKKVNYFPKIDHLPSDFYFEKITDQKIIEVVCQKEKEINSVFSKINNESRLYIEAHGSDQSNEHLYRYYEGGTKTHYKMFAENLANYLQPLKNERKDQQLDQQLLDNRLNISLIICYAGKSHNDSYLNSLAGNIHRELSEKGIYVNLSARITIVATEFPSGKKLTDSLLVSDNAKLNKIETEINNTKKEINRFQNTKGKSDKDKKEICALKKINDLHYKLKEQYDYEKAKLMKYKQPNSKITLAWAQDNNNQLVQVAYDAYEFKKHKQTYLKLKKAIDKFKNHANSCKNKEGYEQVSQDANGLANSLHQEVDAYFNLPNPSEANKKSFQEKCKNLIEEKPSLNEHRHSTFKRLIGQITLGIMSLPIGPLAYFAQKRMIKNGLFSNSLFMFKTKNQQLTDKIQDLVLEPNLPSLK